MISRSVLQRRIADAIQLSPITALIGPRQCGKSTIAGMVGENQSTTFFDLEDPVDYTSLTQSPKLQLESREGLIVLDEVQRAPDLFPVLRVLADKKHGGRKFLILGSASPDLINGASESLAGRISFIDMSGFSLRDIGIENWKMLWFRGSFPLSFLGSSEGASYRWRENFIRAFLERDIPQMGISIPSAALRRFWTMIAHYHALKN